MEGKIFIPFKFLILIYSNIKIVKKAKYIFILIKFINKILIKF